MRKQRSSFRRQRRSSTVGLRYLSLEALEARRLLTQTQYGLFDTGVDANGNALAGGATDPHYTLVQTQEGTAGMHAVVASTLAGGWVSDNPTDAWIAPTANQGASSTSPPGTYEYETTFNVPSANGGNGQLTGFSTADNDIVNILINGNSTGYSQTNAFTGYINFRINGGIVAGNNTLDFIVSNGGSSANPTGLHVKGLTLNFPPTIASDNNSVTVVSGQTATNTGTFNEPDPNDTVTLTASRGTVTQSSSHSGTFTYTETNPTTSGAVTITATNAEGATAITTFNLYVNPDPPPTLTAGGTTSTAHSGGAAVTVDPGIILNDTYGPNLTTATVAIGTNFTPAEDRLLFTAQNGITGSYSTSTGILTLSGSATPAQYQAALQSVQYQDINSSTANDLPRSITFSIAPGDYNPANGHFYQFVYNPGITWTAAKAAADASSIYGLQGYLATLTSAAENTFAFSKTQSTGWIGASDAANPGVWAWADGPENGLQFWSGIRNGSPYGGQYNDWNAGEPNDSGNVEFYAQYLASGLWNDLANTSVVNGYLIEYGGLPNDPTLQLTSNASVNVATFTTTPTVTTPSATTSVNAPNYTLTGTAQAGSLIQVYNDVNHNGSIDIGESVVGSEQLNAGQTSYSIVVPLTQSSPNNFLVVGTVSPYNASTPAIVPTITADSTPPALPVVTSPITPISVNAATTVIGGTAEAGSLVKVYADTNGDGVIDNGETVVGSQQLSNGQTTFTIATPLTQNAADHFLITSTDAAGNASATATVPTITEDSIAPAAPVVLSPMAPISVNTPTASIGGTAEAGSLVKIYSGGSVVGTEQLPAGQTSYSIAVPLTQNASNVFLAVSTDAAGNQSSVTVVPTITENSIAPAAPVVLTPVSPTSVNAGSAVVTGLANPGSLVKIYSDFNGNGLIDIGDVVVGTEQLPAGTSSFAVTVPLAQNVANHFVATQTDAATNMSAPTPVPTITEDSIAPRTPRITGPINPILVNTSTGTITGVAEANSLVQIYADLNDNGSIDQGETVVASEQLTGGATTFSIAAPLIPNATNYFLATATDAAGNESSSAVIPAIMEDSIAPSIPVVLSPSTPLTLNAGSIALSGTADPGTLVQVYQDNNNDGLVDAGDTIVDSAQLGASQSSFNFNVPLTPNSVNAFLVTSTDAATNQSVAAIVPPITEDSIAPNAPVITSPSVPSSVNVTNTTITGTAEAGSLVTITSGGTVVGSEQLAPGQTSFSINEPLNPNAANQFTATATDAAGNVSVSAVAPTITEDSIAPFAPVVSTPGSPTSVNALASTLAGTAEAGSLVTVYLGDTVVGSEQLNPGQTSYSIGVPLIQNADNNFTITATDAAGNVSLSAAAPTITADSIPPDAPIVLSPSSPVSVNTSTGTIAGTAEAGSLVTINSGGMVVGSEQLAPGQTSFSIAVPLTPNADNNFVTTATDAAGNVSLTTVVPTITEDSIAPIAPVVVSPLVPTTVNATTSTLTGTAEAGSLVSVYAGNTLIGTEQLGSGQTSYSIGVPLVQNAANNFTITATDVAGNVSVSATVPTITEDSIAPTAPVVINPSAPTSVNSATFTFTGTAEPGSLVTIYSGNTIVGTEQLGAGQTSYSIAVPLNSNAANNFTETSTDAAGNISSTTTLPTITEDSITPAAPVLGSPSSPTTVNATTTTFTGTAEAGSLVTIYADTNGDGVIDDGDSVVGTEQLGTNQTSYSITVPLVANTANHFLVTSTDAAGNQSSTLVLPTVTESPSIRGTVYLDLNANGTLDAGEPGFAGRVVFLDLQHDGKLDLGDPSTTTDANGKFSFPGFVQGTATVMEAPEQDVNDRLVVDQLQTKVDGSLTVGVVPISPVAPVPVVPSPFTSSPPADSTGAFIQSLYHAVLGRTNTPSEVAYWKAKMAAGETTQQVIAGFVNSPEHRSQEVVSYYNRFLHRTPNATELNSYVQSLLSGQPETKVVESFLNSPEYQASHATPASLVTDLYDEVLARYGDPSEVNYWEAQMTAGMSRQEVERRFVESPEAYRAIVASDYSAFLHRPADAQSAGWVTELEGPTGSPSTVAEEILGSTEYQRAVQTGGR